ncbi:MAG: hypothetical protein WDN46_03515 [Methylocella sp.]
MPSDFYSLAGFVGAAIVIAAFFASQQGIVGSRDRRYLFANLLGAILILVSLYSEWNFPAALIEGFWAAISLYGLVKPKSRTARKPQTIRN